jgi:ribose 5-phosphate isomerase B
MKRLILGADHAGVALKKKIAVYLDKKGIAYDDLGSFDAKSGDDYPDFAGRVGRKVVKCDGIGILVCDTGIGMGIAANKVKGVRAAVVTNGFMAKRAREHNDANVLCLGSDVVKSSEALKIVGIWLGSKASGAARHKRRIRKIEKIR